MFSETDIDYWIPFKNTLRSILKKLVLLSYVYILAPVRNTWRKQMGTCHTTILLYHRVSDIALDSITVSTAQFNQHLQLLSRHFDVLSMEEFLKHRGCSRRNPSVVITFDDGYQDNYYAAKIMKQAKIPCTFFICTGIVGTTGCFPKDLRMGRKLPILSWDQVRKMADLGFDIANHSVSHLDMGDEPVEASLAEIEKASQDLAEKLGNKNQQNWFAYPFGRPSNIKKEVVEQLNSIGIEYCFSAYGGVNTKEFDPHNILRQGVNHTFGNLDFLAMVEGYKIRSY